MPPHSSGKIPSILAEDMRVTGDVISQGEVQIDGDVIGDVEAHALIIGDSAHIRGQITADIVRVSGAVTGRIKAREVVLTRSAKVEGDILHEVLAIEAGAQLQGNCRRRLMDEEEPKALQSPQTIAAKVEAEKSDTDDEQKSIFSKEEAAA